MIPSEGFKQVVEEFSEDIRKTRVILIRWMFLLWVGHIVVLTFLFLVFLGK
jgi:hypothetical protein